VTATDKLINAAGQTGLYGRDINDPESAHMFIEHNKIVSRNDIDGLILDTKETDTGIDFNLTVKKGIKILNPVHLCFGMLHKKGTQIINIHAVIEENASVSAFAHCVFPNAVKIEHIMNSEILVKEHGRFSYEEAHFHGESGGVSVRPTSNIVINQFGYFNADFTLTKGRAGVIDVDYNADVADSGVIELFSKIDGRETDTIKIREAANLNGAEAKGLIKSRVAVREKAHSEVISKISAFGNNSVGHVDCIEIIRGNAVAKAIPLVEVMNETAQITHEASVGRINEKELEALMARGLTQNQAIDLIITGMLK
jgi:uncharacterized protein